MDKTGGIKRAAGPKPPETVNRAEELARLAKARLEAARSVESTVAGTLQPADQAALDAQALERMTGPLGDRPLPGASQAAADAAMAGLDALGAAEPAEPALPARFDGPAKARFITAELDRLGLQGADRSKKQARMEVLFNRADKDGTGQVDSPADRQALVGGLLREAQADAITASIRTQANQQADAIASQNKEAKSGNFISRGFNSFLNVFNSNMDQMDDARNNAVKRLKSDLPADLERFNDMVAAAGDDPAKLGAANEYLEGALAKAKIAGEEFDKRVGDFKQGNKFWSGLAADVGAGLLVLGGTAIAMTGFGAPLGAGLIVAGFAAGGAASVGLHAALDNQYDFKKEALGNFIVGGISAAATVATAGASAGVTSGLAGTLGKYAVKEGVVSGVTSFAAEGANGFQDGWLQRTVVGTAAGVVLGKATGGIVSRVVPAGIANPLAAKAVQAGTSAATGAVAGGGGAFVNEALGGFEAGWQDRVGQQTLGGAVAGAAQSFGPDLAKANQRGEEIRAGRRATAEEARVQRLDATARQGDTHLNDPLADVMAVVPFKDKIASARADFERAVGRTEDLPDGTYTRQSQADLNRGVDPALVAHIDEAAAVISRDVPADAKRPAGRILEQGDVLKFEERYERLLAKNPAALRELHAASYEAVGLNPQAVEKLIYDYTHSSTQHKPEIYNAIADAAKHIAAGGEPRPPAIVDGQPVGNKYDQVIQSLMDTREVRARFLNEAAGLPVADAYRVYRGTSSKGTVDRIAQAWFNGDPAISINNYGLTSSSLDPRAGIDFGAGGPRSRTVVAEDQRTPPPFDKVKEKPYVTYDLDIANEFVLFDKYTDGGFSVDGALRQRTQQEVLIAAPGKALTTDVRRSVITFEGKTYTYADREALRTAMQAAGYDPAKR